MHGRALVLLRWICHYLLCIVFQNLAGSIGTLHHIFFGYSHGSRLNLPKFSAGLEPTGRSTKNQNDEKGRFSSKSVLVHD